MRGILIIADCSLATQKKAVFLRYYLILYNIAESAYMPYFLMIFAILLPLSAAITMPAAYRLAPQFLKRHYLPAVNLCCFICFAFLAAAECSAAKPHEISMSFPPGFDISFSSNTLTALFAALFSFFSFVSSLKISHGLDLSDDGGNVRFAISFLLFSDCLYLAALSGSILWMYVFWQISAIFLWTMTGKSQNYEDNLKADEMLSRLSAGASFMLAGIILAYMQYGTFYISSLAGESLSLAKALTFIPALLMPLMLMPGMTRFSIAGKPSFSGDFMLPAGMMAFAGLCLYAKIFCACFAAPETFHSIMEALSFIGAAAAMAEYCREYDIKKMSVYLIMAMMFLMLPAFSAGNNIGVSGGFMSLLSFLPIMIAIAVISGIREKNTLGRAGYAALAISLFSLAAMPPSGMFFSRLMILCGLAQNGSPAVFILYVLLYAASLFMAIHFLRNFNMARTSADGGQPQNHRQENKNAFAERMSFALAVLAVIMGIAVYYPSSYMVLSTAIHGVNLQ